MSDDSYMETIKSYLDAQRPFLDPDFNVKKFASDMCVSVDVLQKRCIKEFGKSPKIIILERRIRAVTTAIRSGYAGLFVDLYEACGFNSHTVFTQSFKRYTGITPSEYRGSIKKFRPKRYAVK